MRWKQKCFRNDKYEIALDTVLNIFGEQVMWLNNTTSWIFENDASLAMIAHSAGQASSPAL